MRIDVVAAIDRALVAEVIGEGLLAGHLVHVAHQRVGADRQLAGVAPPDQETLAGIELAPRLDRLRLGAAVTGGAPPALPSGPRRTRRRSRQ